MKGEYFGCKNAYIVTSEWNLGVRKGFDLILPLFQTSIACFDFLSYVGSEDYVYKSITIFFIILNNRMFIHQSTRLNCVYKD